jgi:Bacterial Ig-like domain (group 1)/Calcineurin-like phosphoesterase
MPNPPRFRRALRAAIVMAATATLATCSDTTAPAPDLERVTEGPEGPPKFLTPTGLESSIPPVMFTGAGDIASCSKTGDTQTAALLDAIPGPIFALGDVVYQNGTTSEFANCYEPTWGRFKDRTYPSVGNHEYNTSGATPYYDYFGDRAGPRGLGYYSFDLGVWHVVVLNSNIAKSPTSPQVQWLRQDLADHPNQCTLAYFHHPLYSSTGGSGTGGAVYSGVRTFYDTLYAAGVDLVLAGHRHFYERMAPVRPNGTLDNQFGTRVIIVGSGGIGGGSVTNLHPSSEARDGDTRGVLRLHLYEDSYAWKFVPVAGKTFTDSSFTACHGAPPAGGGGNISASTSTVTASPSTITASTGSSAATITVTVKNASGAPVSGATVVLSATGSGNTITQPTGPTGANGVATGTLRSTVAGIKTITATMSGTAANQRPSVTVNPAAAAALGFIVQPSNTNLGQPISPAVQVEVRDQFGNRVTGATNAVTVTLGNNPNGATLGGTTTVAASAGIASFSTLTVDQARNGYTLIAQATGLTNATSSAFNITAPPPPVSPTQSDVEVAPATIAAGGSSTVTITVKDGAGAPLSAVAVSLSATGSGNTLTQPGPTNSSGVTTGTLSSTVPGAKTITAVAGGTTLADQPVVNVTAGAPDAGQSTVTASPTRISAGVGTSTITIRVRDAFGNPASGVAVSLAATGDGNSLTQPGNTDANGLTTGTLGSSVVGDKIVSANAGGTAVTQTATVTVTDEQVGTITHSLLTVGADPANVKVYATAPISPAPNALVTVAVLTHRSSNPPPTAVITGGGMSNWTEVAAVTFDPVGSPLKRVAVFRAMSAAPGSGPLTITFSATVSHAEWIVSQWEGVETSGANGADAIVQTASNRIDASGGLAVQLNGFEHPNNVAYGVFGVTSNVVAITPGSGFTEIAEQTSTEGTTGTIQAEWATDHSLINASWVNLRAGALGLELRANSGP